MYFTRPLLQALALAPTICCGAEKQTCFKLNGTATSLHYIKAVRYVVFPEIITFSILKNISLFGADIRQGFIQ
ncbi:MAG TPA: hypothetical protein PKY84_07645, partial [Thermosynergistes sp.]|nr:hypothetical protein [Thermosynergistes sp.]